MVKLEGTLSAIDTAVRVFSSAPVISSIIPVIVHFIDQVIHA